MTAAISAGSRPLSRACWRMMSSWRSGSAISRTAWWKPGHASANASAATTAAPSRAPIRRRTVRRRRIGALLGAAVVAALAFALAWPGFHHAVREIALPLRHEDIIRQQAREKDLDPALIAGVIYAESKFRDGQVSSAGAQGLMQITPETAGDIARWSGGTAFTTRDLGSPQ